MPACGLSGSACADRGAGARPRGADGRRLRRRTAVRGASRPHIRGLGVLDRGDRPVDPGRRGPRRRRAATPVGYTPVTNASAPTGVISAAKFDALIGSGAAAKLGYRDGIGESYQQTATGYSLQLDLFRFTAGTGAADFATTAEKGVVGDASPAPAVSPLAGVPQAIAVTPTGKDANGHATYGVIAVKGTVVMVVDLAADLDSTRAATVAALARQQYARLS